MQRLILAFGILVAISVSAQKKKTPYPDGLYAEVTTTKGLLVLQLEFEKTPMTVANFVGLAEGTLDNTALPAGRHYYDGSKWHRVVPGHVIQCGMPANSTIPGPGYDYPNEIVPELNHGRAGMAGIANGGPHTNGSQWYITLGDRSYLDGDYTVFGHIIKGMEVLQLITQEDLITTIKIIRIGPGAEAFRPTTSSFKAMVEKQKAAVEQAEEKRRADEEAYIQQRWPQLKVFMRQAVQQAGEGPKPKPGDKIMLRYKAQIPGGDSFVSTAESGKPWYGSEPATFEYVVGTSTITPGFDAGVAQMRKGEQRVLVVPAEQAYGANGYYPPERKGEKRFHISPFKTIIYEVEVLEIAR